MSGDQTTINGQSSSSFSWPENGNTLSIKLNAGGDNVKINLDGDAVLFLDKLEVDLGFGSDQLTLNSVFVRSGTESKLTLGRDSETEADNIRVIASSFFSKVTVSTGGGDDQVEFDNAEMNGGLTVNTGRGNDTLALINDVSAAATIDTGAGDDQVILGSDEFAATFGNALTLKLGDGVNTLTTAGEGLLVGKALTITGGKNDDTLQFNGAVEAESLTAALGDGTNSLTSAATVTSPKSVTINGGKNRDTVQLTGGVLTKKLTAMLSDGGDTFNTVTGIADVADFETNPNAIGTDLTVDLGKGNDGADVKNIFGKNVTFTLGDGNNVFTLDTINALKLTLNGGTGIDTATVTTLTTENFIVKLGNGTNSLNTIGPDVGKLQYTGGTGTDNLVLSVGEDQIGLIDQLFANLGAGDDQLTLSVNIAVKLDIDGGGGLGDRLFDESGSRPTGSNLKIKGFELFPV